MTETHILVVKDKVQRYLSELLRFEVDSDGDYTFRHGSTRMFLSVRDFGEGDAIVRIEVPMLFGVTPSADLYREIAEASYIFGNLRVTEPDEDGLVGVHMNHTLLGTYLDPEELKVAVVLIARSADECDTELQERFGGTTFHEDVE